MKQFTFLAFDLFHTKDITIKKGFFIIKKDLFYRHTESMNMVLFNI